MLPRLPISQVGKQMLREIIYGPKPPLTGGRDAVQAPAALFWKLWSSLPDFDCLTSLYAVAWPMLGGLLNLHSLVMYWEVWMRKLGHREAECLAQGFTASRCYILFAIITFIGGNIS